MKRGLEMPDVSTPPLPLQVAASTGHTVVLVDTSEDILKKSAKGIEGSLKRVVKKKFADKPEVSQSVFKKYVRTLDTYILCLAKIVPHPVGPSRVDLLTISIGQCIVFTNTILQHYYKKILGLLFFTQNF